MKVLFFSFLNAAWRSPCFDKVTVTRLPVVSLYLRNGLSIWKVLGSAGQVLVSLLPNDSRLSKVKSSTLWLDWRAQSGADTWCQTEAVLPSVGIISGGLKPMPLPSGKILISFNILPFLTFSLVLLGILLLCDQVLLRSSLGTHWLFSLKAGAASCLWLCFDSLKCHSDGCRGWYFPQ